MKVEWQLRSKFHFCEMKSDPRNVIAREIFTFFFKVARFMLILVIFFVNQLLCSCLFRFILRSKKSLNFVIQSGNPEHVDSQLYLDETFSEKKSSIFIICRMITMKICFSCSRCDESLKSQMKKPVNCLCFQDALRSKNMRAHGWVVATNYSAVSELNHNRAEVMKASWKDLIN